jgi:ArsR family transcriptional regulator
MTEEHATDEPTLAEAASFFKVLADPNRLRILGVLRQGDSCNGELNQKLGLPPNLLSHHLRVLREAGLIYSRHDVLDARWIYYGIDRLAAQRWHTWLGGLLNPDLIQERVCLCGPEGQQKGVEVLIPLVEG